MDKVRRLIQPAWWQCRVACNRAAAGAIPQVLISEPANTLPDSDETAVTAMDKMRRRGRRRTPDPQKP